MNMLARGAHRSHPAALPNTPPKVINHISGLSGFDASKFEPPPTCLIRMFFSRNSRSGDISCVAAE
jgi:hypothetical protein